MGHTYRSEMGFLAAGALDMVYGMFSVMSLPKRLAASLLIMGPVKVTSSTGSPTARPFISSETASMKHFWSSAVTMTLEQEYRRCPLNAKADSMTAPAAVFMSAGL